MGKGHIMKKLWNWAKSCPFNKIVAGIAVSWLSIAAACVTMYGPGGAWVLALVTIAMIFAGSIVLMFGSGISGLRS